MGLSFLQRPFHESFKGGYLLFVVVVAVVAAAAGFLCTSRSAQHHSLKLYLGLHVSLTRRAHPRVRQLPEASSVFMHCDH